MSQSRRMASSQDFSVFGDAFVTRCPSVLFAARAAKSLDDLEGEFHQLSADHEAQVMLPELAEEAAAVHEELEAKSAPEIQEAEVEIHLAHAHLGVPHIAAVHSAGIKI